MKSTCCKYLALLLVFTIMHIYSSAQIKTLNGKEVSAGEMDAMLKIIMDTAHLPAMSIAFINDGKIVYDRDLGYADLEHSIKADNQTLYEAASMSKTVFAYFIMKMVDKDVIALDTPLYKYYPYPDIAYDERYKLFTARMVLSHTTGLPNWHQWQPADSSLHVPKGAQYIMFTPGTQFSYSGEGYQYLVNVIAHLLHTDVIRLGDIVYKEVSKPLGMKHAWFSWNGYVKAHRATGYRQKDDNGVNVPGGLKTFDEFSAAGGLRTNAVDYAHFILGLLKEKGLSKQSYDEMFKPQSTLTNPDWVEDNGEHWGLGIAIKKTLYGTRYFHSGNNGDFTAYFVMFKEKNAGFVLLTNCNRAGDIFDKVYPVFMNGKE